MITSRNVRAPKAETNRFAPYNSISSAFAMTSSDTQWMK